MLACLCREPSSNNQRREVKNGIVDFDLARKTPKSVGIAFDFVAVKGAVHNGDVNPTGAMAQTQLVQDASVLITAMLRIKLPVKLDPHISITHHSCTRLVKIDR
jgi:hypothetical protein